jgi:hypothetical protein
MWKDYPIVAVSPGMKALIIALVVWSIVWKGIALWRAARNGQSAWYVVMLIVNTAGILEIIYLLGFSKPKATPSV